MWKTKQTSVEAEVIEPTKEIVTASPAEVSAVGETGLTHKQVVLLSRTILKWFTSDEMGLTFHVAKSIGADLFAKEMWAFKDSKGNLVMVSSHDYLLKKAYENPAFASFASGAVYDDDEFIFDYATGTVVKHIVKNAFSAKRGKLVGAWCVGTFTDGTKIGVLVDYEKYKPWYVPSAWQPWGKNPEAMIVKCGESVVFRKFARLGNVYAEEEVEHIRWEKQVIERPKKPDLGKLDNLAKNG